MKSTSPRSFPKGRDENANPDEAFDQIKPIGASRVSDSRKYLFAKRFFDLLLSSIAIICLSPFLVIVACLIVMDDPKGGPFFVQDRIGKNGNRFRFFKFRSMVVDAEEQLASLRHLNEMDGPVFKIKNDPRITRFGRLIRLVSIDELPQLFNILIGDMSLVGPRPALPEEVEKYGPYEMQRLLVKPGLTCYWQARGRNQIMFHEWMQLDMKYVYNHNLFIDIKIILLTIRSVVTRKGAM